MGWTACTNGVLTLGAWILPGILYAWQFPHFNALSWNLRPDYSRAGYRMMAVTNPDLCRRTTVRYTTVLMALCYLAPILDVTHWWFALASTPLNASFFYLGKIFRIFVYFTCMYICIHKYEYAQDFFGSSGIIISIILAWKFNKHSDSANSRKLFRFSLLHLPLLMLLILLSKKYWINTEKQEDKIVSYNVPAEKNNLLTIFTSIASTTSSM
jgi:protoheme IX farnesyltransferase